jgi:DNA-binding SARP family transcriptional activator/DNA-binding XRE family transcriptional regulator
MGLLIKRYRNARQFTQRELAEAARVSIGTLRDLEQGRSFRPRWATVESVATALEFDYRQHAELARAWQADARFPAAGADDGWDATGFAVARVRIDVLGPIAAWSDGAALPLGSLRRRAVLGLLALNYGVCVHRDAIVDVIWGAKPPPSAVAQVYGYVWRLRKLVGPGRDGGRGRLITTVGASYQLEADVVELDAATFQHLADHADRVAAQDRLTKAIDLYEQALKLWRGDVLTGIDLLRAHPAATELAQRRSDAVMRFADVAVRVGVPHRALAQLRELCARDCFNEAAHAHLMTALAAVGQQAAALETFARLRRRLDSELGIRPGRQLVETHAQVLRQAPLPRVTSAPDVIPDRG